MIDIVEPSPEKIINASCGFGKFQGDVVTKTFFQVVYFVSATKLNFINKAKVCINFHCQSEGNSFYWKM